MNPINMAMFIFVIVKANFIHSIHTEPKMREKREYSDNVGNYYSNFNHPDNAITTVLPPLDSDGTSNVASDVHGDDDALVSHWTDDGTHYFRDSTNNKIKTISDPPGEKQDVSWYNDDVPDNFMDIRDKKLFSFYPLRLYPKRAPSGFLGLRGKKYFFDGAKRVPSGFTGMRGKKSGYTEGNNIDDSSGELELMDDSSFYELLQKERRILDQLNELQNNNKAVFNLENAFPHSEKRAPSGFLGMRGKKAAYVRDIYSDAKRAPYGFLGLRGKRDIEGYNEGSKRGPFIGYLGMRGKKEPLVPDRYQLYSERDILNWPVNDLRTEIDRTPPKRVPYGFVGVRGKKWTDISIEE